MFSDPVKNLKQLNLKEDMIVADLGAGTGFYTIAASKMVPRGKVYAIELQRDFLNTIKNKIEEINLNNVECFWGDVETNGGTQIKDNIVDAVILSNILFQIENKDNLIKEIYRILKKKGLVLLIDWSEDGKFMFSKNKNSTSKKEALELFQEKGFILDRQIDAGKYDYGMILIKE